MNVLAEQLPKYLGMLRPLQRRAVELSFGIGDQIERSVCEASKELGLGLAAARRERDAGIRALRAMLGVELASRHLLSVVDDADGAGDPDPDAPVAVAVRRRRAA